MPLYGSNINLCVVIVSVLLCVSLLSLLSFSRLKMSKATKRHGLIFEYFPCFSLRNRMPMLSFRNRCRVRSFIPFCSAICVACAVVNVEGSKLTMVCYWLFNATSLMMCCTLKADSLKYSVSRMARSTVSKSMYSLPHSPQVHRAS